MRRLEQISRGETSVLPGPGARGGGSSGPQGPALPDLEILPERLRATVEGGKTGRFPDGTVRHEAAARYGVAGPAGLRAAIAGPECGDDYRKLIENTLEQATGPGCSTWNIPPDGRGGRAGRGRRRRGRARAGTCRRQGGKRPGGGR